jgi:hypothetical protein
VDLLFSNNSFVERLIQRAFNGNGSRKSWEGGNLQISHFQNNNFIHILIEKNEYTNNDECGLEWAKNEQMNWYKMCVIYHQSSFNCCFETSALQSFGRFNLFECRPHHFHWLWKLRAYLKLDE